MAIYDGTIKKVGTDIRAGLEAIAAAIENRNGATYNVIVNTAATNPEEIAAAAQEVLERTQAREAAVGRD